MMQYNLVLVQSNVLKKIDKIKESSRQSNQLEELTARRICNVLKKIDKIKECSRQRKQLEELTARRVWYLKLLKELAMLWHHLENLKLEGKMVYCCVGSKPRRYIGEEEKNG
ncbi:Hypothetical predicted protein [Olea europaea subsp. europaea]|uniref:Uncharacterized protein n=1 Tax=Olea europaea subsp. europaea TaxID=158383 RepID=A0A8S0QCW8_OLEEU|nr:Hypothetical predicted protein [Olea europaea subsp. europaea]